MIEIIMRIWTDCSFPLLFSLGTFLVCCRMPGRKFRNARLIISPLFLIAVYAILAEAERLLGGSLFILIGGGKFMFVYILMMFAVVWCYDCGFMAASFCATIGYSVQHISLRALSVIVMLAGVRIPDPWDILCECALFAVVCALVYLLGVRGRRSSYRDIKIDSPLQLVTTAIMLAATIFIEIQFFAPWAEPARQYMMFEYMMSTIVSVVIIMLEINIMSRRHIFDDFKELQRLLGDERKKYEHEKANVDMINLKCHDIRHQLRAMNGKMDPSAIGELSDAVDVYNTQIKTGSEAIDVVLSTQGLYCLRHDIRLTCLIDGTRLDFIPDHELYALFGNAIENAVHAVERLDKERRVIAITESRLGRLTNISITNYFDSKLRFEDGLPVSSREGHGFGTRSMRMIVEKYGGRLTVNVRGDLFMLNIFLPTTDRAMQVSAG